MDELNPLYKLSNKLTVMVLDNSFVYKFLAIKI